MGKRSSFARRPMDRTARPMRRCCRCCRFSTACSSSPSHVRARAAGRASRTARTDLHPCRRSRRGQDALLLDAADVAGADAIITNPPWTRELLHPLISHFQQLKPTWLLFDADWCHTQAGRAIPPPLQPHRVGRPGEVDSGLAVHRQGQRRLVAFRPRHDEGPRFYGRMEAAAA